MSYFHGPVTATEHSDNVPIAGRLRLEASGKVKSESDLIRNRSCRILSQRFVQGIHFLKMLQADFVVPCRGEDIVRVHLFAHLAAYARLPRCEIREHRRKAP